MALLLSILCPYYINDLQNSFSRLFPLWKMDTPLRLMSFYFAQISSNFQLREKLFSQPGENRSQIKQSRTVLLAIAFLGFQQDKSAFSFEILPTAPPIGLAEMGPSYPQ